MSKLNLPLSELDRVSTFLKKIKNEQLGWQIVYESFLPGKKADYAPYPSNLSEFTFSFLQQKNIKLYSHQAQGIELILKGKSVCLATPTASGKSLVYNLPVLEGIIKNFNFKALYIFPLKALAQDQVRIWKNWEKDLGLKIKAELYDGDTSSWKRKKIRENPPHILATNPEMLHLSLLPYFELWLDFFRDLKMIVVDEVHTYRGLFGSHLAWVFRRLKRRCNFLGNEPQFVFSSATIANPVELIVRLTEIEPIVLKKSGAKRGDINFVFLRPLWSTSKVVLNLMEELERLRLRTIIFTKSRRMTELLFAWGRERKKSILPYRAGYRPEDRRKIEQKLFKGEINTVVATSALELGVDIGHLDVCLILGYPGSIMSTWQRIGRVGRKGQASLVLFLGLEDALDEYFLNNPEELILSRPEEISLNPFNPYVMGEQLPCLLYEGELKKEELSSYPQEVQEELEKLWLKGKVLRTEEGSFVSKNKLPARKVNLRSIGSNYNLFDEHNNWLGDVDSYRVYKETHPGAVYVHLGKDYLVVKLDNKGKRVFLKEVKLPYYTRALTHKETKILEVIKQKELGKYKLFWGKLEIKEQVIGYEKRHSFSSILMGRVELDLPPFIFETEGFWLTLPVEIKENIQKQKLHFMGGIHGLEHLFIGVLPLLVLSDRNDFGGISFEFEPFLNSSAVFVYDAHPGGAGLTSKAFEKFSQLQTRALTTLRECKCEVGCPLCIHSPKCGSGNRPLDKRATLKILEDLTGQKETKTKIFYIRKSSKTTQDKIKDFVVFDVETRHSAYEVGGWKNAAKMGISVLVAYFSKENKFVSFKQEEIIDFWESLQGKELIIGFNTLNFDYQVLAGLLKKPWTSLPSLDLLQEIKKTLGYRISLDNLAKHTLGAKKSGHGLLALKWWKEGKVGEIIKYCKQDVYLTKELYLFGREKGYVCFQNKAKQVVQLPVHWR